MSNLQIFDEREVLGKQFRIYGDAENPLFLAKDVAEWIEYDLTSVNKLVGMVDDNEKVRKNVPTLGGSQEAWFLTEDGLYEVLMQSRKPIAKEFKKQVKEILRTIRKTGSYTAKPLSQLEILVQSAQALLEHEKAIKQLSATQSIQASRIEQIENKIEKRCTDDFMLQLVTPAQIGKMFEPALSAQVINAKLRDAGLQWKVGGEWVATCEGKKYSSSEPIQLANGKMIYQLKWQRKVKDLIA